jgi:ribosomal protein S18 acetylase RimI-like enzyme
MLAYHAAGATPIRPGRPGDEAALWATRASALSRPSSNYRPAQLEAWIAARRPGDFAAALLGSEEVFLVAESGASVLGFASVVVREAGQLWSLFVRPEAGGRGVGSALLAASEAACLHRGRDRVEVAASLDATDFYRARGYRGLLGFDANYPTARGPVRLGVVAMTKRLLGP